MHHRLSRSAFIGGSAALAGASAFPNIARGADLPHVRYQTLSTGFGVILNDALVRNRFDVKHGIAIDITGTQPSLDAYYNDFIAGTTDIAIGGWDAFAQRYLGGAPIALLATLTNASMTGVIAGKGGPSTPEELKGKTVAGVLASGTYRLVAAALRDFHGVDLSKDATTQNVQSPATAVTLVVAGRADAAVSWEPNLSVGVARDPAMKVIYDAGPDFVRHLGTPMPFFGLAGRRELLDKNPGIGTKIAAAFSDAIRWIGENPQAAIAASAPKMDVPPAALQVGFAAGRFGLDAMAMSDPRGMKTVETAAAYLQKNGQLPRIPDRGFYGAR
jgi:NitT/TauT family transport system substrate-binding protein